MEPMRAICHISTQDDYCPTLTESRILLLSDILCACGQAVIQSALISYQVHLGSCDPGELLTGQCSNAHAQPHFSSF